MEPAIIEMHGRGNPETDNRFRLHNAGNDTFWVAIIVILLLQRDFGGQLTPKFSAALESFSAFRDYGVACPQPTSLQLLSPSADVAIIFNDR